MYKIISAIAAGSMLILGVAGASHAADTETKQPLDQAVKSVDKNLAKDPDNKGLQNAAERLQTNKERHAKKRAEQKAKREEHRDKRAEKRAEREKAERAERPEKAERPERAERPEKPARPGR